MDFVPADARKAILSLAEVKTAIAEFDEGESNVFEVLERISAACKDYLERRSDVA
jgi:hypothetical protein